METNKKNILKSIIDYSNQDLKRRLSVKNSEYASPDDVYHNFILGAKLANLTPQKYLWVLMTKHLVSVLDIIETGNNIELIPEKCGDIRAYISLLEGMYNTYK